MINVGRPRNVEQEHPHRELTAQKLFLVCSHPTGMSRPT